MTLEINRLYKDKLEAKDAEILRLRGALETICDRHELEGSCDCWFDEVDDEHILCDFHIAMKALETGK